MAPCQVLAPLLLRVGTAVNAGSASSAAKLPAGKSAPPPWCERPSRAAKSPERVGRAAKGKAGDSPTAETRGYVKAAHWCACIGEAPTLLLLSQAGTQRAGASRSGSCSASVPARRGLLAHRLNKPGGSSSPGLLTRTPMCQTLCHLCLVTCLQRGRVGVGSTVTRWGWRGVALREARDLCLPSPFCARPELSVPGRGLGRAVCPCALSRSCTVCHPRSAGVCLGRQS